MTYNGGPFAGAQNPDNVSFDWTRSGWMSPQILLSLGVLIAGSLYGGMHLLAWNGSFLIERERLLWRISGLIVASPILVLPLIGIIALVMTWLVSGLYKCIFGVRLWISNSPLLLAIIGITAIFYYAVLLVYVAARACLVVECFIHVAHFPADVFKEPSWSRYMPHFGSG
jgi:hypothetical protein